MTSIASGVGLATPLASRGVPQRAIDCLTGHLRSAFVTVQDADVDLHELIDQANPKLNEDERRQLLRHMGNVLAEFYALERVLDQAGLATPRKPYPPEVSA